MCDILFRRKLLISGIIGKLVQLFCSFAKVISMYKVIDISSFARIIFPTIEEQNTFIIYGNDIKGMRKYIIETEYKVIFTCVKLERHQNGIRIMCGFEAHYKNIRTKGKKH